MCGVCVLMHRAESIDVHGMLGVSDESMLEEQTKHMNKQTDVHDGVTTSPKLDFGGKESSQLEAQTKHSKNTNPCVWQS